MDGRHGVTREIQRKVVKLLQSCVVVFRDGAVGTGGPRTSRVSLSHFYCM